MSDTYWFDLVYLTHYSLAHPLNIGAHRAIQIARHINELCERATIMLASWFLHRWIRNKNAHKTPNINFRYHNLNHNKNRLQLYDTPLRDKQCFCFSRKN